MLRFFLPPRQDIATHVYPDGFHQEQAIWLRETMQDKLSVPSPCCEERFSIRTLSGNIIVHREVALDVASFGILPVPFKEKSVRWYP